MTAISFKLLWSSWHVEPPVTPFIVLHCCCRVFSVSVCISSSWGFNTFLLSAHQLFTDAINTHFHHIYQHTRRTSSTWTHFPVIYLFHPPGLYSAWTHKQAREMCEGSIFHFRARRGESRDTIIIPEGERESSRRRRERSERKKEEMEDEIRTNCKKNEE